jgi:hypothetical protein
MLAVGIDARGNPVNLYTGEDFIAAQTALDAAGQAGTVDIRHVFKNPPPAITLRYGRTRAAHGIFLTLSCRLPPRR